EGHQARSMGDDFRYREEFDRTGSGSTLSDPEYFKGWDPGERKPLTQPAGIDVRTVGSSKSILLYGLRPTEVRAPVTTDRPVDTPVVGGVLELRYDDPDFDRKLQSGNRFDTLRITGIKPEMLHHWVDGNGYFFWSSSENSPKFHHYPGYLKTIE